MAAYLWHYDLIPHATFIAVQGHLLQRPGRAFVEVIGHIQTVKVGGSAVTVLRGELAL